METTDKRIEEAAKKYELTFGCTYLSTSQLQIKAFIDGAKFGEQLAREKAVKAVEERKADLTERHKEFKYCGGNIQSAYDNSMIALEMAKRAILGINKEKA